MTDTSKIERACMAPLDQRCVSKRQGPGSSQLSYVDQHYVRRRLCEVFGPLGFDTETTLERVSGPTETEKTGRNGSYAVYVTEYVAKVRVTVRDPETGLTCFKEGSAAGVGEDKQINWSVHCAVTEAETDALKRAAMQLGDSFGLALYDKRQEHVASAAYTDAMATIAAGKWSKEFAQKVWPHLSASEKERVKEAVEAAKEPVAEAAE